VRLSAYGLTASLIIEYFRRVPLSGELVRDAIEGLHEIDWRRDRQLHRGAHQRRF
jgi:hypothetical protein